MKNNSVFTVKYEKEVKESPWNAFVGARIFLEFLKLIESYSATSDQTYLCPYEQSKGIYLTLIRKDAIAIIGD